MPRKKTLSDRRLWLAVIKSMVELWGTGTDKEIVSLMPEEFTEFARNPRATLSEMSKDGLIGYQQVHRQGEDGKYRPTLVFHLIMPRSELEMFLGVSLHDYIDTQTVLRLARVSKTVPKRKGE